MPDLVKVVSEIETLARPKPVPLLAARGLVQRTPEIQDIFCRSRDEQWAADRLATELEEPLQSRLAEDSQDVFQVARYLADEYQQLGDTMLLISRETGKAIGRLTDDDFWQPPPVPREGGEMVQPPPRLKPELEAAIIYQSFDRGWEKQLVAELAPTLHQTELLRTHGDPRLLPLTHVGRSEIVAQIKGRLPNLLRYATGGLFAFLRNFELLESPPQGTTYEPVMHCTILARAVTGIQDMKATNLRFDRLGTLCAQITNSWGREIARTLAVAAVKHFRPTPRPYHSLTTEDTDAILTWVTSPEVFDELLHFYAGQNVFPHRGVVFPTEGAPTVGLLGGRVGALVIDPSKYDAKGRELFGRWEVAASLDFTLWVDWAEIRAFQLEELPAPMVRGVLVQ